MSCILRYPKFSFRWQQAAEMWNFSSLCLDKCLKDNPLSFQERLPKQILFCIDLFFFHLGHQIIPKVVDITDFRCWAKYYNLCIREQLKSDICICVYMRAWLYLIVCWSQFILAHKNQFLLIFRNFQTDR